MSAHNFPINLDRAFRVGFFDVKDPGDSGTISWHNKGMAIVKVVTAGAESRALPAAGGYGVGTRCMVIFDTDGGDLTITGSDQTIVLADAGDMVEFVVARTKSGSTVSHVWRVASDSRQAGSQSTKEMQIPIGPNWVAPDDLANLSGSVASGDLALVTGTMGTSAPTLYADGTPTGEENYGARTQVIVPEDYVGGTNIELEVDIVVGTALADVTIDLETLVVRQADPDASLVASGDESLVVDIGTDATYSVTLEGDQSSNNIAPGDALDIRLNLEITDDTGTPATDITIAAVRLSYTGNDL